MLDSKIKFIERYDSQAYETVTLYFDVPKEKLNNIYRSEEELEKFLEDFNEGAYISSATLSLEFPQGKDEPYDCNVGISPTVCDEDYYTDVDWRDIDLPDDEIEELIQLAYRNGGGIAYNENLTCNCEDSNHYKKEVKARNYCECFEN